MSYFSCNLYFFHIQCFLSKDFNGGFKDSREFRKTLPRHELTEEEKEEKRQNQPSPVRMDYSITKVIRHLKMNDRQSELDVIKRERRDSDNSAVVLVERHIDDDLIGHVEPDPDDINFQEARLREGELTKEEKKRWKRRYRGEAVFMVKIYDIIYHICVSFKYVMTETCEQSIPILHDCVSASEWSR